MGLDSPLINTPASHDSPVINQAGVIQYLTHVNNVFLLRVSIIGESPLPGDEYVHWVVATLGGEYTGDLRI